MLTLRLRWTHVVGAVVALAAGGLLIGWLGLVGVRASTGHWAVTDWFLHWVMRNSVRTAALGVEPPPLDDPALLPAAAGHYQQGCAICHGSPDEARSETVMGMLPQPPDLKAVVPTWKDAELFEIVQHGVRFTGMPAWPTQDREDEVWAMAAFLRQLPQMEAGEYRQLAGRDIAAEGGSRDGAEPAGLLACEACHAPARDGRGGLVPRLEHLSEAYLTQSLRAYAAGTRPSGIMQTAVSGLDDAELIALSRHYARDAAQTPEAGSDVPVRPGEGAARQVGAGEVLATRGRPEDEVPACASCHDNAGKNPLYPDLSGQNPAYLAQQLRLFRQGIRAGSPASHLMSQAAKHLTDSDIAALSVYYGRR